MDSKEYDYLIVGSGPSGLAFAHCCSKIGKRVLIVEKENTIGGCHRVRRVNALFTEHGPRIYSSTYKSTTLLLNDMNVEFSDIFTPYKFKMGEISGQTAFNTLAWSELYALSLEFIKLLFNDTHGKKISVKQFMIHNTFKEESVDLIDRLCRLTDGASSDHYTLNQFLQLVNQQIMYTLYQPKLPNDVGLFQIWKTHLINSGVDFIFDTELVSFNYNSKMDSITDLHFVQNGKKISTQLPNAKVVLALPPKNMNTILINSGIRNPSIQQWAHDTAYLDYITIVFHWEETLDLPKVYGFTKTDWGVVFIVLSDYMTFNQTQSKTVISVGITRKDYTSKRINKTTNDCNEKELLTETFLQLKESFPDLPEPNYSILSPGVYKDTISKRWMCKDTAFISTANKPYIDSRLSNNLYTLGTHNGNHHYKFTSMESAITNGIVLANQLEKETTHYYKPVRAWTVRDIVKTIVFLIIVVLISKYYSKKINKE